MEKFSFEKAHDESLKIQKKAEDLKMQRGEYGNPNKDYSIAEGEMEHMHDTYKSIDRKQYDILRAFPERIGNAYANELLNLARKDDRIADVGFGSGTLIIPLSKLNDDAKIYGIDYSEPLAKAVSTEVENRAELIFGDLLTIDSTFDIVHFKAILHCFENPEEAMDKIKVLVENDGYLVTGHENSQIEDRIEQLFNVPTEDEALESLFIHYFELRAAMGKPFTQRAYPAGDAQNAVNYLCKDGDFKLVKTISHKNLSWKRVYTLNDLLYSIKHSTYNVFSFGLSEDDKIKINAEMSSFAKSQQFDLQKEREISADFTLFVMKKVK